MRCNKCGFEINESDKFCYNCGELVTFDKVELCIKELDNIQDGNIKVKRPIFIMVVLFILFICLIGCTILLISGLLSIRIDNVIYGLVGIFAFGYILLISPYIQNSNNYLIRFKSKSSFSDFELFYKNKLVVFNYKIGKDGKFAFSNNDNKLNCVSYAHGSKMSNFVKYRVINYFSVWLENNNLLSSEVTQSFEEL